MRINGTVWSARDIAARIDHTVLAPDATRKDMENACALARAYGFKAVFTNPYWTPLVAELLDGSGVAAGISAAFPLGSLSTDAKVAEVMDAVARVDGKPCAVDMVTNIALLKEGAFRRLHTGYRRSGQRGGRAGHHRQGDPRNVAPQCGGNPHSLPLCRRSGRGLCEDLDRQGGCPGALTYPDHA